MEGLWLVPCLLLVPVVGLLGSCRLAKGTRDRLRKGGRRSAESA